jgi:site-specific recombinase XerD
MLSEWDIRDFLGYVANETNRWGLEGNGSEPAQRKVSHTTVHHYFVVLANFFNWVVREGFLPESPTAKIKVAKPKDKVIKPYSKEEVKTLLQYVTIPSQLETFKTRIQGELPKKVLYLPNLYPPS